MIVKIRRKLKKEEEGSIKPVTIEECVTKKKKKRKPSHKRQNISIESKVLVALYTYLMIR